MNQVWWNKHAESQYNTFKDWVGNENAPTKKYSAEYCFKKGYTSVVDMGCADSTFLRSLQNVDPTIQYMGVDSCTFFVNMNKQNNIPVIECDITNIPELSDSSFDICFSRHTIEHQPSFEPLLKEMIRIGKKEACHIFFIKPDENPTSINFGNDLYHNRYSRADIETYLLTNTKVRAHEWIQFGDEVALHILLN